MNIDEPTAPDTPPASETVPERRTYTFDSDEDLEDSLRAQREERTHLGPAEYAEQLAEMAQRTYDKTCLQIPPGVDRQFAVQLAALEASLATYWLLKAKLNPPA